MYKLSSGLTSIICTFNNSDLLIGCLSQFKQQRFNFNYPFELIVVDNNSTDSTKQVVDQFIEEGEIPNLRYIFEGEPGLTNARLAGVKNSFFNWVAFIDDDIRIQEDWVDSAVKFVQSHPQAGVIGGRIQLEYQEPPSPIALKCEQALCKADNGEVDYKEEPSKPSITISGAAIILQKKALVESGWLEQRFLLDRTGKSLSSGGDTEILFRIKNKGWEVWYCSSLKATHLIPPHRTTISYMCRLHRGLGRSSTQLRAIARSGKVPLTQQVRELLVNVGFTARRIGAWLFHDVLLHQKLGDKRFVQIFEGIGRIESCWNLLLHPIKID